MDMKTIKIVWIDKNRVDKDKNDAGRDFFSIFRCFWRNIFLHLIILILEAEKSKKRRKIKLFLKFFPKTFGGIGIKSYLCTAFSEMQY